MVYYLKGWSDICIYLLVWPYNWYTCSLTAGNNTHLMYFYADYVFFYRQSLICFNGSRMSCGSSSNDRVMRWIMLFLVLVVAFTLLFIIHAENENFKKTILIQAKYSGK